MTVTLKDVDDRDLWSTRIEPRMETMVARRPRRPQLGRTA